MLSWFGRLAGWVTITTVAWAELWVGNLARERDKVPGKSRNRDVEFVGYHARKLQWLDRGLGGRECAVWLRGRLSGLMKGALEINAGTALAGEKESFQAHRGGAVSYP